MVQQFGFDEAPAAPGNPGVARTRPGALHALESPASDKDADPQRRTEVALSLELDELHQLLYTRGGIRPVHSAVDELAKLLLLQLAVERFPNLTISPHGPLADVMRPDTVTVDKAKAAFRVVVCHPAFVGRTPTGEVQAVWPPDEPLRITRADVLSQALSVLAGARRPGISLHSDPLGVAFDTFLQGKFEHAGGLGTHLTPATVAHAMARVGLRLVNTADSDPLSVGDPCCGTGRFLIAALQELSEATPLPEGAVRLIGADQSPSAVAKARVNLLGFGIEQPTAFTVGDSVTDSSVEALAGTCDLILTNPPFGEGKYDSPQGIAKARAILPAIPERTRIDPALAFLALCLHLLRPGGVLGIVLPDGVVEGPVFRLSVLADGTRAPAGLEALISLPSVTFAPGGTMAKTSAVFLRRSPSRTSLVHIGRAEHIGYLKRKSTVTVDPEGDDLPSIVDGICARVACDVAQTASHASDLGGPLIVSVLRSELSHLEIGEFDSSAAAARELVVRGGGLSLGTLLRPIARRRQSSVADVPFISVLHVDDLGVIDWRLASLHRPKTPGVVAEAGELIVSLLNPGTFRASVIPVTHPVVRCSAEFGVFEAQADPFAVLALLQHPLVRAQLAPLGRGTSSSRRRIAADDVLRVIVHRRSRAWYAETGAAVRDALTSVRDAQTRLIEAYSAEQAAWPQT